MSEDKYTADPVKEKCVKKDTNAEASRKHLACPDAAKGFNPIEKNGNLMEKEDTLPESDRTPGLNPVRKSNKRYYLYRLLCILLSGGILIFACILINEVIIEPYRSEKAIEKTSKLYSDTASANEVSAPASLSDTDKHVNLSVTPGAKPSDTAKQQASATSFPDCDAEGRLLKFKDLLSVNEDVKGWITIPDTNIDYVVLQSGNKDHEYYLTRNIFRKKIKTGSLFLDYKSAVTRFYQTQNLVIHGHNMTSTDNMFHYLMKFKDLDYYKKHPVITFDTIYQTGQWKIFAVLITNGTSEKEPLFPYTQADFDTASGFLNFVYQLRIRSLFHIDTVDINENDQLLTLSTCSYEVKNYRTVIVARKVREGEDTAVDVDSVTVNPAPLYPSTWYYRYGGKTPKLSSTFEEAFQKGEINWYTSVEKADKD